MSRHVLRQDDTYTVVVGYDDPLDSFFAQVYDEAAMRAEPDGPEILLVATGQGPQDVTDADECVASIAEYLTYAPGEIVSTLNGERERRQLPTQFQRETFRNLLGGELP